MKKTFLAIFVATTAAIALPAMASGNSANLVITGYVFNDSDSCNVTLGGATVNNIVTLNDVKTKTLEDLAINMPAMSYTKDVIYKITDCKSAGRDYSGNLSVNLSGEYISGMEDVLTNQVTSGAATNASVTLINNDNSRIKFDGSDTKLVAYTPGAPTFLRYKATYVKTANNVTAGEVKGTAIMTISY